MNGCQQQPLSAQLPCSYCIIKTFHSTTGCDLTRARLLGKHGSLMEGRAFSLFYFFVVCLCANAAPCLP